MDSLKELCWCFVKQNLNDINKIVKKNKTKIPTSIADELFSYLFSHSCFYKYKFNEECWFFNKEITSITKFILTPGTFQFDINLLNIDTTQLKHLALRKGFKIRVTFSQALPHDGNFELVPAQISQFRKFARRMKNLESLEVTGDMNPEELFSSLSNLQRTIKFFELNKNINEYDKWMDFMYSCTKLEEIKISGKKGLSNAVNLFKILESNKNLTKFSGSKLDILFFEENPNSTSVSARPLSLNFKDCNFVTLWQLEMRPLIQKLRNLKEINLSSCQILMNHFCQIFHELEFIEIISFKDIILIEDEVENLCKSLTNSRKSLKEITIYNRNLNRRNCLEMRKLLRKCLQLKIFNIFIKNHFFQGVKLLCSGLKSLQFLEKVGFYSPLNFPEECLNYLERIKTNENFFQSSNVTVDYENFIFTPESSDLDFILEYSLYPELVQQEVVMKTQLIHAMLFPYINKE